MASVATFDAMKEFMAAVKAVSYTHLDVYKRQLSGFVRKSTEKSLPLHTLIQKEMMKHSISDFEIMRCV